MLDKKVAVKVAVKKPTKPAEKPAPASAKPVAKVAPSKSVVVKPVAVQKAVVNKPKPKPVKPVQSKLINKLLNKPKVKETTEKKISKFIADKIPKKMVEITRPNNSALLSMMEKNIGSALS